MTDSASIAPKSTERLRMHDIHKRFGPTIALSGVDLHVNGGEVLALVGENGAGKSTLMKILSGAYQPDRGQMWIDGQPYSPKNPLEARRSGIAMIYQELSLASHLTVAENILLGMEPHTGPFLRRGQMREQASKAMQQLGRPDILPDAIVSSLSTAQQQLVEIGRAVAVGCRVLVLDEPTSSLTQSDVRHLFDLVKRLKSQGLAIVHISHFLEELQEISDRLTILRDGKTVGHVSTGSTDNAAIISMMVGRSVDDLYPRSSRQPGDAILEIHDLAGRSKPKNASLTLHRGEVVGIAGLIGAGRTEFLRSIFGLQSIRSGKVRLGTYSGPASPAQRWQQGAGMISEDRKGEGLALGLSLSDNITMTKMPFLLSPSRQDAMADRWIGKLAVRCRSASQSVGNLSGGNQQKIALARLFHHDVDVLLLDEPTRGIDVGSKAQIYQLIDELACAGKAVLIVSSYLPELLGVCDRIAVMCKGKLGPAVSHAEASEHTIMLQATGANQMLNAE